MVRWCFTEGIEFTDPFFHQTVEHCMKDLFRLLFWRETDIVALAHLAIASPGLDPAGFIFHTSRSGSTLVAQMFASLPSALVMSEPDPLDTVLRAQTAFAGVSDADTVDWLRWMVSALGQQRIAGQSRLVVKLDAWAILCWPAIRRAFPDTPCVFVYRDPTEVVLSQLGHRGFHMVPGTLPAASFGLSEVELSSLSPSQYCAAVLARLCEAALPAARDGSLMLIDYASLPHAVSDTVAPHFGFEVGPPELALFASVAERDAKNPVVPFVRGAANHTRDTPELRAIVDGRVGSVYAALEAIRESRS